MDDDNATKETGGGTRELARTPLARREATSDHSEQSFSTIAELTEALVALTWRGRGGSGTPVLDFQKKKTIRLIKLWGVSWFEDVLALVENEAFEDAFGRLCEKDIYAVEADKNFGPIFSALTQRMLRKPANLVALLEEEDANLQIDPALNCANAQAARSGARSMLKELYVRTQVRLTQLTRSSEPVEKTGGGGATKAGAASIRDGDWPPEALEEIARLRTANATQARNLDALTARLDAMELRSTGSDRGSGGTPEKEKKTKNSRKMPKSGKGNGSGRFDVFVDDGADTDTGDESSKGYAYDDEDEDEDTDEDAVTIRSGYRNTESPRATSRYSAGAREQEKLFQATAFLNNAFGGQRKGMRHADPAVPLELMARLLDSGSLPLLLVPGDVITVANKTTGSTKTTVVGRTSSMVAFGACPAAQVEAFGLKWPTSRLQLRENFTILKKGCDRLPQREKLRWLEGLSGFETFIDRLIVNYMHTSGARWISNFAVIVHFMYVVYLQAVVRRDASLIDPKVQGVSSLEAYWRSYFAHLIPTSDRANAGSPEEFQSACMVLNIYCTTCSTVACTTDLCWKCQTRGGLSTDTHAEREPAPGPNGHKAERSIHYKQFQAAVKATTFAGNYSAYKAKHPLVPSTSTPKPGKGEGKGKKSAGTWASMEEHQAWFAQNQERAKEAQPTRSSAYGSFFA